jgi:hypothetical protein
MHQLRSALFILKDELFQFILTMIEIQLTIQSRY